MNIKPSSQYFGQRGTVFGSGPSKKNPSNSSAVIYVCWPDGGRFSYFPNRLALAPMKEHKYRISTRRVDGKKVQIHEVPASSRKYPTIFERFAAIGNTTS